MGQLPAFPLVSIALYERLRPDVAIVDLRLAGLGGIEAIGAIRRIDPRARILALTSFGGGAEVKNAVAAGASGFLLNGASGEDLMAAVRKLRAGRKAVAPEALLASLPGSPLSRREAEILELMALGLRNQEIADRLGLALGTVELYVTRLLETLDAKDRGHDARPAARDHPPVLRPAPAGLSASPLGRCAGTARAPNLPRFSRTRPPVAKEPLMVRCGKPRHAAGEGHAGRSKGEW